MTAASQYVFPLLDDYDDEEMMMILAPGARTSSYWRVVAIVYFSPDMCVCVPTSRNFSSEM